MPSRECILPFSFIWKESSACAPSPLCFVTKTVCSVRRCTSENTESILSQTKNCFCPLLVVVPVFLLLLTDVFHPCSFLSALNVSSEVNYIPWNAPMNVRYCSSLVFTYILNIKGVISECLKSQCDITMSVGKTWPYLMNLNLDMWI